MGCLGSWVGPQLFGVKGFLLDVDSRLGTKANNLQQEHQYCLVFHLKEAPTQVNHRRKRPVPAPRPSLSNSLTISTQSLFTEGWGGGRTSDIIAQEKEKRATKSVSSSPTFPTSPLSPVTQGIWETGFGVSAGVYDNNTACNKVRPYK